MPQRQRPAQRLQCSQDSLALSYFPYGPALGMMGPRIAITTGKRNGKALCNISQHIGWLCAFLWPKIQHACKSPALALIRLTVYDFPNVAGYVHVEHNVVVAITNQFFGSDYDHITGENNSASFFKEFACGAFLNGFRKLKPSARRG